MCWIFIKDGVIYKKQNKAKKLKKQHFPNSTNKHQFCKFHNTSIITELKISETVSKFSMPPKYYPKDF